MSLKQNREAMRVDIDSWTARMTEIGEQIPDLWEELDTSARLTEWLLALGYRKVEPEFSHRPGDVISVEMKIRR